MPLRSWDQPVSIDGLFSFVGKVEQGKVAVQLDRPLISHPCTFLRCGEVSYVVLDRVASNRCSPSTVSVLKHTLVTGFIILIQASVLCIFATRGYAKVRSSIVRRIGIFVVYMQFTYSA